ncbi:gliding motility-associated C-terminal domain-containing protein [Mesonia sp. HuA40]|uniref:gliding motility-associated C-terminal domain-containing protein n=1 Tax=Mesonia sp. HuA40 TaxID=2602761 RepID=UPI0011CBA289|nr:gliding motility-associated C-terminal domain-containing protein [Mesonia sp. HuA40]TXK73873.1 gliding motility-associated C-terminal domain-containing protein [Mesonia sp. HuA40]
MNMKLLNLPLIDTRWLVILVGVLGFSINSAMAQCTTPPPVGESLQDFCSQTSWNNGGFNVSEGDVLTDLLISGENLTWYDDNNGVPGNPIANPSAEEMVDGATYYVTQTPAGGCESTPLVVTVNDKGCGCIENRTFETQDGQADYSGYSFYKQPYQVGHKTCGGTTLGAATITGGDQDASIVASGIDPTVQVANVPTTNPNNPNSQRSLRLNSNSTGQVAHATTEFVAGEVFVFNFSMILEDPSNEHAFDELPHFQVRVYDVASGDLYADRCIISIPTDCIFTPDPGNDLLFSEWSCVKINTLGLIGQRVRVEFTATDCTLGGHFGYTYVDDLFVGDEADANCDDPAFGYVAIDNLETSGNNGDEGCVIGATSTTTGACGTSNIADALPFPLEVCGTYVLPQSSGNPATIDEFRLDILQNNTVVGSLTNPVLDPVNGTFCFTVTAQDVNASPYGDFNFETYAEFGLNCGRPQVVPIDDQFSIDICPDAGCPAPITVCDDTGTGIGTFDLTQATPQIQASWAAGDLDITYYETEADAFAASGNEITNLSAYNNTIAYEQVIYARVDWNPNGVTGSDCYYLVKVELNVDALPVINIDTDRTVCGSSSSVSTNIVATPDNLADLEDIRYVWFKDGVQLPHTGSYYTATEPGQYTFTVWNNDCEVSETVNVEVIEFDVDLGDPMVEICSNSSYTITANIIDNTTAGMDMSQVTYAWSNGETTPSIDVTESGDYSVDVTYEGCTVTEMINVQLAIQPIVSLGDDITFCSGDSNQLMADVSNFTDTSGLEFTWFRDDVEITGETGTMLNVSEAGVYKVRVNQVGVGNCFGEAMVNVGFYANENCVISEGLSPDTTPGENDNFDLSFLDDRTGISSLQVFNRYGRIVFEKNNYRDSFIGQDKDGNKLPTGTYFYVIEFKQEDAVFGKSKKGWIYINREAN